MERTGHASEGLASLHPLDTSRNIPPEKYSLEVRRQVARRVARDSFDESLQGLAESTAAEVPKRQAEALVQRAAGDFDRFYEQR